MRYVLTVKHGYGLVKGNYYVAVRPPVRHIYYAYNPKTLNFYNNIKNSSSILVLYGFLWKLITLTGYYSNEADIYSRIPQADFYGSVLYFVWTSFWYLPSYVLLLVLVAVYFRTYYTRLNYIIVSMLLLTYSCTLVDYQVLNVTSLPFYRGEN